jgi:hypothetical protein
MRAKMSVLRWIAGLLVAGGLVPLACSSRTPPPRAPLPRVVLGPEQREQSWQSVRSLLETRCVVCHGCYDAPCQLKLGTFAGIERGATERQVYDAARLSSAEPTRLGIDAQDVAGWRKKEFHSILPEASVAPEQSVLLRMLELKRQKPLPPGGELSSQFTFELDRKQTCASAEHFDQYASEHPLWGMPYGLPGLDPEQERAIASWVQAGSPHSPPPSPKPAVAAQITAWEEFLNDPAPKAKLAARYVFEHLFLASIRFEGDDEQLFRLVRSRTPPGSELVEIATRRPFGDPKTTRPYYRFVLRDERPLDKTYMPYALGPERLARFRGWFWDPSYEVSELPGYASEEASNPFKVFSAIPSQVRYRFMLEEAQFTLMGFIKGPVCRGQAALNVIRDRFWVTFLRPDTAWAQEEGQALSKVADDLSLPAEFGSDASPTDWLGYSGRHQDYMKKRWQFFRRVTKDGELVRPDLIWDGDGNNQNAALTVFRHFDSATVVKGLVGGRPRSTWVLSYPILERIHYLLVAGFDVYGSAGHQLATRLYMDFLRLEAESLFMAFLPPGRRVELGDYWYRGVTGSTKRDVATALQGADQQPNIEYRTRSPERELLQLFERRLDPAVARDLDLSRAAPEDRAVLKSLDDQWGRHVTLLPETSFLMVTGADGNRSHYSILRDTAYANVATLFNDDDTHRPDEDELTVVPGFLGAYPNALFAVTRTELPAFVAAVAKLTSPEDYRALRQRYGVLRSSPRFWTHADLLQLDRQRLGGEAVGLLDFNRLDGF